jgi:NAD+ kinase
MSLITSVGVVAKSRLQVAAPHLIDVEKWLADRNLGAVFETATAALMPPSETRRVADKQSLVNEVGLVLVLGGDGTLLSMADCIGRARLRVPILGVNFGSLGFLTEVTLPELYPALEAALAGHAHVEERLTLRATIVRPSGESSSEIAVNDVVINKGARSRLIDLSIRLGDGQLRWIGWRWAGLRLVSQRDREDVLRQRLHVRLLVVVNHPDGQATLGHRHEDRTVRPRTANPAHGLLTVHL